jgi:hypothetical protein
VGVAIEAGRTAFERARQTDEINEQLLATGALVRALLCSGSPQDARVPLAAMLRLRHSQVGSARYEPRLLLGDYHMAMARWCAGLAALDPETGLMFAHNNTPGKSEVREQRRDALHAWRAALRVGRSIDARLQCQVRELELEGRQRWIDQGDSASPSLPYITA